VGKSSVFNALAGADRAIVTSVPGTTRDLITETIDVNGLRTTLVDTAGMRDTVDVIEAEGVARSKHAQAGADLTLAVLDRSKPLEAIDHDILGYIQENKRLIVVNKSDVPAAWEDSGLGEAVTVSALTG